MSVSATFAKVMTRLNETSEDIECRMLDSKLCVAYTSNNLYVHVIGTDTITVLPLDHTKLPTALKVTNDE